MTLTLSQVPALTPYAQYIATASQTVFPYPFPITADQDLVVVVNGVTYSTDVGYTLSGQGQPTGGFVTFTTGLSAGAIVTVYRDIVISRVTQIAQNSGFSSTAFNAEFNNIYLILQQLAEQLSFALQIPNSNNPAPTTTLVPGTYAGFVLGFDANGNPQPVALTATGTLTGASIAALLNAVTTVAPIGDRLRSADEIAAGVTPVNYAYEPGNILRYGAVMDGTTDDSAAFSQLALVMGQGTSGYLPPLPMMLKSQVTIVAPAYQKIELRGYGCTIFTTGAIDGLQVMGGYMGGLTTYGITIDNSTDSLSTAGFRGIGCQHCDWVDCSVKLSSVIASATSYACIRLEQSTVDDQNTGAFWNTITRFQTRQPSGNPSFYASYGVLLTGSANATTIQGCEFTSVNVGIGISAALESGSTGYIANAVLIHGNHFEGTQYAVFVDGFNYTNSNISGLRIVNNRSENVTAGFLFLYRVTVDSPAPTWLSGNYYVSNTASYVTSSSGAAPITVNTWEPYITPHYSTSVTVTVAPVATDVSATLTANWTGFTGQYSLSFSNGDIRIGTLTHASTAVTWTVALTGTSTTAVSVNDGDMTNITAAGRFNYYSTLGDAARFGCRTGWGISLDNGDSAARTWAVRNRSGGGATLDAPGGQDLQSVNAISGTSTSGKNLRGTATFSAATTKAVTITTEPDANYYVALSGNAAGYCWVTAKGTTGFTINCSSSNSNTVDWILIR